MIIKIISDYTGLNPAYLEKLVRTSNHLYKDYYIKKKKKGRRLISHPSKELKFLQRWMIDNVFYNFPVQNSVFSYKKKTGIQDLANIHKKNNFLLRTDFENFFTSIKSSDVTILINKNLAHVPFSLSKNDIETICKVVCKNGELTIGAPSSPIISNSILFDFDSHWYEKCKEKNIVYSRYADDLYFSTNSPNKLGIIYTELKDYVDGMKSPRLMINRNKTVFTSKKHKRIITGLILTSTGKVSIGRQKKRYIKSLVHKYINNDISKKELSYLCGYLSYVNAVEPAFIERLEIKYEKKIITEILSSELN